MRHYISTFHKNAEHEPSRLGTVVQEVEFDSLAATKYHWSPALFRNKKRAKDQFKSSSLLVYDVDNDPAQEQLTLETAKQMFGLYSDYPAIILTSRNHQKDKGGKGAKDRFRLIFQLSSVVEDIDLYEALLKYYADKFKISSSVDKACLEGARFYYKSPDLIADNIAGKGPSYNGLSTPLDIGRYLNTVSKKQQPSKDNIEGFRGSLIKKTLEFISQQPSVEPWHKRFIAAAIDLMKNNYTQEEAAEQLAKASPLGELDKTDYEQLDDVYRNNRGKPSEPKIGWPDMKSHTDANGDTYFLPVKDSINNIKHLITVVAGIKPKLNSRTEMIEVGIVNGKRKYIRDVDVDKILLLGHTQGVTKSKDLIQSTINTISEENEYDPLISSIDSIKWDGVSRIKQLLETLTFSPDIPAEEIEVYEMFLRKWLIGVVNKIYNPGSENNILVFVGAQGAGKTRWFRRLAEPFNDGFIESHINPDDKDSHANLLKYFLWSISELDTITYSKDVGALKDFTTKSEVRVRQAYARYATVGSSISSFCASVNSRDFLHDTTGNRRFLVISIEGAEPNHSVDIMQVYAECKVRMERGEVAWFNRDEIRMVDKYNDKYTNKSDILELFEERVIPADGSKEKKLALKDILAELNVTSYTKGDERNLRDWLTKRRIENANHSGVKKYLVKVLPKDYDSTKDAKVKSSLNSKSLI